jgi:gamma-glutamyltranspeptidase/glutathione hydrolase
VSILPLKFPPGIRDLNHVEPPGGNFRLRRVAAEGFLILQFLLLAFFAPLYSASRDPVRARNGMVVSADGIASRVGIEILKKGGNAVDAAVAVGFALAVVYPQAGNIGGGGYMLIRMADGTSSAIDFRERAPTAARRTMYLNAEGEFVPEWSQRGALSVGVPGSAAGLLMALDKYGTMDRDEVLDPAIRLAEEGFVLNYRRAESLQSYLPEFLKFPSTAKVFTKNGGPFHEGDTLVQNDLARTLRLVKEKGRKGFYKGENAERIVAQIQRDGGLIVEDDLENYAPIIREPLRGSYRGYEILSMGPSSSGGVCLIQLLNMVEEDDIEHYGFLASKTLHLFSEAMKRAFADRAEFLGDPDFVDLPTQWLTSKEYGKARRSQIDVTKATPASEVHHGQPWAKEEGETTHYSVVDQFGNVVSVTTTLNDAYGSKLVVEGAGFFLNNEMDDFSAAPGVPNMYGLIGSEANSIQPGKRMLSSMAPTIVLKDGKPFLTVGSPGGPTIISTVFQVIVNVIDFKMNIQEAVDAPRIHHQWFPDTLYYEKRSLPIDVIDILRSMGQHVVERSGYQGMAEAILVDQKKGLIFGASDPRGDGDAVGY